MMASYDIFKLDNAPVSFLPLQSYDDGTIKIALSEDKIDEIIAYGYYKTYEFMKNKMEKT
jgi:hypothetical protein